MLPSEHMLQEYIKDTYDDEEPIMEITTITNRGYIEVRTASVTHKIYHIDLITWLYGFIKRIVRVL